MKESCMSTEKPSAITSEKYRILDVTQENDAVVLVFPKESLTLSYDTYASGYYYPGKVLSQEEFSSLKKEEKLSKAKKYVSLLLSRGRYTEKEMKDRVSSKFRLSEKEISLVFSPYLESGVIDDNSYMLDYLESKSEAGYGKNYLLSELKRRGIKEGLLSSPEVLFYLENAKKKLPYLIQKEERKRKSLPEKKKKEQILAVLLRRGYPQQDSLEAVEQYFSRQNEEEKTENRKNEELLFKTESKKCYNAVKRKYPDAQKRKQAFYAHLLRKGYDSSQIERIIKEEEMDFHD